MTSNLLPVADNAETRLIRASKKPSSLNIIVVVSVSGALLDVTVPISVDVATFQCFYSSALPRLAALFEHAELSRRCIPNPVTLQRHQRAAFQRQSRLGSH